MNEHELLLALLQKEKLIDEVYALLVPILEQEITDDENKSSIIILFLIYFSLLNDGNITMSLNKEILTEKWNGKLNACLIQAEESENNNPTELHNEFLTITMLSNKAIYNSLSLIDEKHLPGLIGEGKMFRIEDGYLYALKYHVARKGIISSLDRLFSHDYPCSSSFDYKDYMVEGRKLTDGQEQAVLKGIHKNLIITGGPGTGKTTSVLFLLINLLFNRNIDETLIYLVAPSGKASSRMKESILNNFGMLKPTFSNDPTGKKILEKLSNLEESTIHRLLGRDFETNGFAYNKNNQFGKNSIFVIDEASMIDASLFHSLLQAIPDEARIFIMGDKNQLPSVDCGAVFGDLLVKESLKDNIVELKESKRFSSNTKIFALAQAINDGTELPLEENDFHDFEDFVLEPNDEKNNKEKPVFCYKDGKEGFSDKDIIQSVSRKWGEAFYKDLQEISTDLHSDDEEKLREVFSKTEFAKILCASNQGERGINGINRFIKKQFIDPTTISATYNHHFPGEMMMINKNNKMLDLYNGDSGILVSFKDDDTLYFMVKKSSNLINEVGKKKDRIFKLGVKDSFVFYPLRMISAEEIDLSYAITIHKSQGSDYNNILVILPNQKGHPLLNRQIVYTAITRTKGNTYILSSLDILNEAKNTVLIRDTNIS